MARGSSLWRFHSHHVPSGSWSCHLRKPANLVRLLSCTCPHNSIARLVVLNITFCAEGKRFLDFELIVTVTLFVHELHECCARYACTDTVLVSMPFFSEFAGHNYIGTEHILLGVLREGDGIASRVLEAMGVNGEKVCFRMLFGSYVGAFQHTWRRIPITRPSINCNFSLLSLGTIGYVGHRQAVKLIPCCGKGFGICLLSSASVTDVAMSMCR